MSLNIKQKYKKNLPSLQILLIVFTCKSAIK